MNSFNGLPIGPKYPWLAPISGFSDLPFRLLCREHGCQVACTEMISAKGVVYNSPGTRQLLQTCKQDTPLVVQVFGSEGKFIAKALEHFLEIGFEYFDLNAGCPVKKVVKSGAGASLLKNLDNLISLAKEMVSIAGNNKVGVKIRSGWSKQTENYIELGQSLEAIGVGWLTFHPRSAVQAFSGRANWDQLKKLKEKTNIPIIGSGDILTAQDAYNCLQQTGIDGIMFARGALNNPMVFNEYKELLENNSVWNESELSRSKSEKKVTLAEREHLFRIKSELRSITKRHIELSRQFNNSRSAFLKMRKIIPRYLRSFCQAREVRQKIVSCRDWNELIKLIQETEGKDSQEI